MEPSKKSVHGNFLHSDDLIWEVAANQCTAQLMACSETVSSLASNQLKMVILRGEGEMLCVDTHFRLLSKIYLTV